MAQNPNPTEARFTGLMRQYSLELLPSGAVRVTDRGSGAAATSTHVERPSALVFDDVTLNLEVDRGASGRARDPWVGDEILPEITPLSNGRALLSWVSPPVDAGPMAPWVLWGRVVGPDGVPLGEPQTLARFAPPDSPSSDTVGGVSTAYNLTPLPQGGFAVGWVGSRLDRAAPGVELRLHDANGAALGPALRVSAETLGQVAQPHVAALADGRTVVSWAQQSDDGLGWGVAQRVIHADGRPAGTETLVVAQAGPEPAKPLVAPLGSGGWALLWNPSRPDMPEVRVQVFDAAGGRVGAELVLGAPPQMRSTAASVADLPGGGFALALESHSTDGEFSEIRVQRFDPQGRPIGESVRVHELALAGTLNASARIDSAADGTLFVTWASYDGATQGWNVRLSRLDAQGVPQGPSVVVHEAIAGQQTRPDVAVLSDGRPALTWQSRNPGEDSWVVQTRMALDPAGTLARFTLVGDAGPNVLELPGVARIDGRGGADTMIGGDGDTTYVYDLSQDRAIEQPRGGRDTILAYDHVAMPDHIERVELMGQEPLRAWGNEEDNEMIGSGADNYLHGSGGNDRLLGGDGADTLLGSTGADTLIGGRGPDLLIDSHGPVQIDGGDGNDTIDLSAQTVPAGTVDGGPGIDRVVLPLRPDMGALVLRDVEVIDAQQSSANAAQLAWLRAQGVSRAENLLARVTPTEAQPGVDVSGLQGTITLLGSNAGDRLVGNEEANRIEMLAREGGGAVGGADTVVAGAGDDLIVWTVHPNRPALEFFNAAQAETRTYRLSPSIDGAQGQDRLVLDFGTAAPGSTTPIPGWIHAWNDEPARPGDRADWNVDLSGAQLRSIESLQLKGFRADAAGLFPAMVQVSIDQALQIDELEIPEEAPTALRIAGLGEIDNILTAHSDTEPLVGGSQSELLRGRAGNDTLAGGEGDDLLAPGGGRNQVLGGEGNDTVVFDGPLQAYTLVVDPFERHVSVTRKDDPQNVTVASGVEWLAFSDQRVAGPKPLDLAPVYGLFVVALNAAPGAPQMEAIVARMENGATPADIAKALTERPEFRQAFAPDQPDLAFAQQLVDRLAGDTVSESSKAAVVADLTAELAAGATRADVVLQVARDLASLPSADPEWGEAAQLFRNKVAVARYHAENLREDTTDPEELARVIDWVTPQTDTSSPQRIRAVYNNAAPVAEAVQSLSTPEDTALSFTVAATDPDAGDRLTFQAGPPEHGVLSGGAEGRFRYVPKPHFNGTDAVVVTITDAAGASTVQTLVFTVTAVNDAPQVVADPVGTLIIGRTGVFNVVANDRDLEGDPITLVGTPTASLGSARIVDGRLQVVAPLVPVDEIRIDYTISDGAARSNGVLKLRVVPPSVTASASTVDEGDSVTFTVDGAPSTMYRLLLGGTAQAGADHSGPVGAPLELRTDDTGVARVSVQVLRDKRTEGPEALTALLLDHGSSTGVAIRDTSLDNVAPVFSTLPKPVTSEDDRIRFAAPVAKDANAEDTVSYRITEQVGGEAALSLDAAGLPWLEFRPSPNFHGIGRITLEASDGTLTSTARIDIQVNPINDAPALDLNGGAAGSDTVFSYVENQAARPLAPAAVLTDIDSLTLRGAQITISDARADEALAFNSPAGSGIRGAYDAATGTLNLSGAASIALYQAALRSVSYTSTSDNPLASQRTVTFTVDDGSMFFNRSLPSAVTIQVTAVNDAPALDLNGPTAGTAVTLSYAENQPARPLAPSARLTDVDSAVLRGAVVTLRNPLAEDVLAYTAPAGSPISGSYDARTGVLTLTGNASPAQYQAAIRAITYANSSDSPNTTNRVLTLQVDDGAAERNLSNAAVATLIIGAINDAPEVDLNGAAPGQDASLAYTENQPAQFLMPDLVVRDADTTTLTGAIVSLANPRAEDLLAWTLPPASTIVGTYTAATGTLTFTGNASVAAYQAVLRSVTYVNTSDNPNTTDRAVAVQVNDGAVANNLSTTATANIILTAVNDAPAADLNGAAPGTAAVLAYVENQAPQPLAPAALITDIDSTQLSGAIVRLASPLPEDELVFAPPPGTGITGSYSPESGVLTLSGSATLAQYLVAIRAVSYVNRSDNPSTVPRAITVQIDDGGAVDALSTLAGVTVTIAAVNDAPVVDLNGTTAGSSVALNHAENQAPQAIAPLAQVTDADGATLSGAVITLTNAQVEDVLALGAAAGSGITATYAAATGTLTLTGVASVSQYEAALRSVTYFNTSENPNTTARTVNVSVSDGGAANALSTVATATITVGSSNDAPVADLNGATAGTGNTVAYVENQVATAIMPQATIVDTDSATLTGATISLATARAQDILALVPPTGSGITASFDAPSGVLTLSGTAAVAQYQAALRLVTYFNNSDNPETANRTLTVQLNDGSAAQNLSAAQQITLVVGAVNDAPALDLNGGQAGTDVTATFTENQTALAPMPAMTLTDLDSATLTGAVVTLVSNRQAEDVLAFSAPAGSGITGSYVAATGVLSLTGVASVAQYQEALRSVTFFNASESISPLPRVLVVQATDAQGLTGTAATAILNVVSVNDTPTVDLNGTGSGTGVTLFYTDNQTNQTVAPLTVLADLDSPNLAGAVVMITNKQVDDTLSFTAPTGSSITGTYNPASGTLNLTGVGTLAQYQAALRSVTYGNASASPSTVARTIEFTVNDGATAGNLSLAATATVHVSAGLGNDALVGTAGSDVLIGGAGNDTLTAYAGADTLIGGDGNDRFVFGDGVSSWLTADDSVVGGSGNADTIVLTLVSGDVALTDAVYANVSGVERLDITNAAGLTLTLGDRAQQAGVFYLLLGSGTSLNASTYTADLLLSETAPGSKTIVTGSGGDGVYLNGVGGAVVNTQNGADMVRVEGPLSTSILDINTGDGDDHVLYFAVDVGGGSYGLPLSSLHTLNGGAGNDTLNLHPRYSAGWSGLLTADVGDTVTRFERLILSAGLSAVDGASNDQPGSGAAFTVSLSASTVVPTGTTLSVDASQLRSNVVVGLGADGAVGGGDDTLFNETLQFSAGPIAGAVSVQGGAANDTLSGGAGVDTLRGGDGIDTFVYNSSDRFMVGGQVVDLLDGGAGEDIIQLNAPLTITPTDSLERIASVALIYSSTASVTMTTNARLGSVYAFNSAASTTPSVFTFTGITTGINVKAGQANDTITGGSGNDTLDGFTGSDTFYLGGGTDLVLFVKSAISSQTDTIHGFGAGTAAGADRVLLYLGAMNSTAGLQNFIAQGSTGSATSNALSAEPGALVIQDIASDGISLGANVTAVRLTGAVYDNDAAALSALKLSGNRSIFLDYSDNALNEADALFVIYSRPGGTTAVAVLNLGGSANGTADTFDNTAIGDTTATLTTIVNLVGVTAAELVGTNIVLAP